MDYILKCENCECRYIEMIEHNGDLMARGIGEIYTGTITLGLIDNKDDKSSKKSCKKLTEEYFLLGSNKELCCFEFSKSEPMSLS